MKKEGQFFYGWVIVASGIFVFALGYGARYSFSLIYPNLLEQFHWSRDATAAMLSFHILAYGIAAPIAGALVDRIGPKKTMGLGVILLAIGTTAAGFSNELWHFYLSFGLVMGTGLSLAGSVPFTRIVSNWFVAKRGLALSFMFVGTGGGFILFPLIAILIEKVGWRGALWVEAAIVAGLLLPCVAFLLRYHPREMGLLPDGVRESGANIKANQKYAEGIVDTAWAAIDWTLLKAMKTPRFWLLCFTAFAVWGISEHIQFAHHVAFAEDVGYSKLHASSALALFGVFFIIGTLSGFISDRIGREVTFTIGTITSIAGIVMLMLIEDTSQPWMLYTYSILFGLGLGISTPTIAAACTDIFQGKTAGAIIGFVWFAFAIGGTIGPWLGGFIFEVSGSYLNAFIISATMFALACISFWLAAPRMVRLVEGRGKSRQQGS